MKRAIALLAAVLLICSAHAAKVHVRWTNPTSNTDGTPVTNLASVTVEWGSCSGAGIFGTPQASITVPTTAPGAQLGAYAFPVGLAPACLHAKATNSLGKSSAWSAVVQWTPTAAPGKPVTLGQPVTLPH